MTNIQKNTITSIFGHNLAAYLEANAAGWIIDRFSDTRTVLRGPNTGKMECQAFAATDIAKDLIRKYLGC